MVDSESLGCDRELLAAEVERFLEESVSFRIVLGKICVYRSIYYGILRKVGYLLLLILNYLFWSLNLIQFQIELGLAV